MRLVDHPAICPNCNGVFYITSDGVLAEIAEGDRVFPTIDGDYTCPYCDVQLVLEEPTGESLLPDDE